VPKCTCLRALLSWSAASRRALMGAGDREPGAAPSSWIGHCERPTGRCAEEPPSAGPWRRHCGGAVPPPLCPCWPWLSLHSGSGAHRHRRLQAQSKASPLMTAKVRPTCGRTRLGKGVVSTRASGAALRHRAHIIASPVMRTGSRVGRKRKDRTAALKRDADVEGSPSIASTVNQGTGLFRS